MRLLCKKLGVKYRLALGIGFWHLDWAWVGFHNEFYTMVLFILVLIRFWGFRFLPSCLETSAWFKDFELCWYSRYSLLSRKSRIWRKIRKVEVSNTNKLFHILHLVIVKYVCFGDGLIRCVCINRDMINTWCKNYMLYHIVGKKSPVLLKVYIS